MQDKTKFFLILFILVGVMCFAQTPPTPRAVNEAPPPPAFPVDGGLVILIAAGAFYGVKKSLKH
ncbi:PID-CTERM protein-sorting domain-containing protein [Formosa sp. 3Alg 14/1]|uniref:PID-CTERM protein-sorting domain-containing protein n=1 Tax=Formosa sp. 3Alg 14/1 TaxID=3382190 RepID=UPI0039BE199A